MAESSNIRKLLCDRDLGLIPHLEKCLNDFQASLSGTHSTFHVGSYDVELGTANTHRSANEQKPLVTQSISLTVPLAGLAQDKLELFLLGSELQNKIDLKIIEWSELERRQYDIHGIPLKQPVTRIEGAIEYQLAVDPANSSRLMIQRKFDITYGALV